jgi:hypothetical protein
LERHVASQSAVHESAENAAYPTSTRTNGTIQQNHWKNRCYQGEEGAFLSIEGRRDLQRERTEAIRKLKW